MLSEAKKRVEKKSEPWPHLNVEKTDNQYILYFEVPLLGKKKSHKTRWKVILLLWCHVLIVFRSSVKEKCDAS
jgi:ABC-type uncharacterized transport system substrate-binding protein